MLVAALAAAGAPAAPAAAQSDLAEACDIDVAFCRLTAQAAEVAFGRVALAAAGANPVPGTASTVGMRIGSMPRWSIGLRLTGVPMSLPPVATRGASGDLGPWAVGVGADLALGVLEGWAPLPTVGGVGSLDVIGSLSWVPILGDGGYDGAAPWSWALGARVGVLRESFTLPGASVTATYRSVRGVRFGDASLQESDSYFEGDLHVLGLRVAATKTILLLELTGGVGWDRIGGDATLATDGGALVEPDGWSTDRVTIFGSVSYAILVWHFVVEAGWQAGPPDVDGLPAGNDAARDGGLFGGLSFRLTI